MRTRHLLLPSFVLLFLGSCSAPPPAAPPPPDFRPTASVREIMESIVDPSSDFIWDSIETSVDASGVKEKAPRTNEEWALVRHQAVAMTEATNLLLIPGRHIAPAGSTADDPQVELAPDQIEALVNKDRQAWTQLAHGLYDAGMETVKAIDARDVQAYLTVGDHIDKACEKCHQTYWYPKREEAKKE